MVHTISYLKQKGMSIMFHWASFLTYAAVTSVTPGPNNIMSMSNANRRGFRGAMPFNFGILSGYDDSAFEIE